MQARSPAFGETLPRAPGLPSPLMSDLHAPAAPGLSDHADGHDEPHDDGNHARIDGFVSLGVIGSAIVVALGFDLGDPLIGLVITLVILKITWDSWRTVSTTEPGEMHEH